MTLKIKALELLARISGYVFYFFKTRLEDEIARKFGERATLILNKANEMTPEVRKRIKDRLMPSEYWMSLVEWQNPHSVKDSTRIS